MITKHSIDLTRVDEPCFAWSIVIGCQVLSRQQAGCGTYRCPFYKPRHCREWIRVEDKQGVNLVPPEDMKEGR